VELCEFCGHDTSPGSGLWVDRIGHNDGWMCRDCQTCEEWETCFHYDCTIYREERLA
jgi:hypothetical protein